MVGGTDGGILMKTQRTLTILLAVLVVVFAFLWLSGKKSGGEQSKEIWHTNVVQVWHTNIVEGLTNIVRVERTNTVVKTVTNVVTKQVPAKLAAQEKQAGAAGAKYLKAPSVAEGVTALYKASPVAVEAHIDGGATNLVTEGVVALRKEVETVLGSRNIRVSANSPYQLVLRVSGSWITDTPRVALLSLRLELRETVALQRQNDIVKCPAAVWGTTLHRLVRTIDTSEEVEKAVEDTVQRFCDDFTKAKESEKKVESRLPTVPRVFQQ